MEIKECIGTKFDYYQLKAGEDLIAISNKFNISPNKIIRNNPNVDFYEGEVVKLIYETGKTHIVRPMENLVSIAQKYCISVEDLIRTNNLKSTRLFIGQQLIINE